MEISIDSVKLFFSKYADIIDIKWINIDDLTTLIVGSLPKHMAINDFYEFVANTCIQKSIYHPDYNTLAKYICVDNLHLNTPSTFLECSKILYDNKLITNNLFNVISANSDDIEKMIITDRDYNFDFFGIKTLERSYLFKTYINNKKIIIERPQYLIMRVALGIHNDDMQSVSETYNLISDKYFTHATPTLFNAGTNKPQLSSCFLLGMDDNLENILDQIKQIGLISKWSGGIGVHLSALRGRNSLIKGTNGISEGILPLCVLLDKEAKYINQGGKRPGSIACYLEPHHCDIFEFCDLRKNTGNEDERARDLFLALWISDLFMKRVENDEMWSLMCPSKCPNLNLVYGKEFEDLYISYEKQGLYNKQVNARQLWKHIMESQIETGMPYILYKDHANNKSNQKNLGTIRSSNLCAEIIEYSDKDEVAVCNLASICLPRFVINKEDNITFDYEKLISVCRVIVRNLNKIIDINFYPIETGRLSNNRHRPIGVGVQGLADVYNLFDIPFDSEKASSLNKLIFETIYYACLDESKELAKKYGSYSSFKNSPFSEGKLQFHLWNINSNQLSGLYDWDKLTNEIQKFGTRNSLLTALMPTQSTAQIMNCSECFEPIMSNIFIRTTSAGEFFVINQKLVNKLIKSNLWNDDMRKLIMINNGSIQNIKQIPQNIKNTYKTCYELKLNSIIKQSAERGPFIDQSQSMNLFTQKPNYTLLTSALFLGWKLGLKTGMYYLRSTAAVSPIRFGIDIDDIKRLTGNNNITDIITAEYDINNNKNEEEPKMCKYIRGKKSEGCESCSG